MAAPTTTARTTPDGFRLDNGHQTLITFAFAPGLDFWEKEVQPFGFDGGDAIDTTTMHNVIYRTKSPRNLLDLTEHTVVGAYDPCVYVDLLQMVNVIDSITITFPDTSTLTYWGYIRLVEVSPLVEGEQPEMTLTIVPTNYDACNCVEAGPVIDCNGTCTC